MIFYNNNDLDDDTINEIIREKEEEQDQYIQEQYDKGIIQDYSSKNSNNIINGNAKTNSNHSKKEKQESPKEVYSQKYIGNDYLAEAVLIGNKPCFAVTIKRNFFNDENNDEMSNNN